MADSKIKLFEHKPEIGANVFVATRDFRQISKILQMDHVLVSGIGELLQFDNSAANFLTNWSIQEAIGEELLMHHGLSPDADAQVFNRLLQQEYGLRSYKDLVLFRHSKCDCEADAELCDRFWQELLSSLHLSLNTIFDESRTLYATRERMAEHYNDEFKPFNLERRIFKIQRVYNGLAPIKKGKGVKIFNYIKELGAFVLSKEYQGIASELHLYQVGKDDKDYDLANKMFAYWHNPRGCAFKWIGNLLAHGSEFGSHLFDNWQQRNLMTSSAKKYGAESQTLYLVNPDRFYDGNDEKPQHSSAQRKRFWTDVFDSLQLSLELICSKAQKDFEEGETFLKDNFDRTRKRAYQIHEESNASLENIKK